MSLCIDKKTCFWFAGNISRQLLTARVRFFINNYKVYMICVYLSCSLKCRVNSFVTLVTRATDINTNRSSAYNFYQMKHCWNYFYSTPNRYVTNLHPLLARGDYSHCHMSHMFVFQSLAWPFQNTIENALRSVPDELVPARCIFPRLYICVLSN